jgi:hypothetical protein
MDIYIALMNVIYISMSSKAKSVDRTDIQVQRANADKITVTDHIQISDETEVFRVCGLLRDIRLLPGITETHVHHID